MNSVGVQLAESLDACVGGPGRERARVLRRLPHDEHEPVSGPHRHRLVAGRVTGRREDAYPLQDLAVTLDGLVARVGKVDPLDDGVTFTEGEVELGLLDVDR